MHYTRRTLLFSIVAVLGFALAVVGTKAVTKADSTDGDTFLYANRLNGQEGDLNLTSYDTATGEYHVWDDTYPGSEKKLFLAPDKNFVAVTLQNTHSESEPQTFIRSIDGDTKTEPRDGSFISWSPDSKSVLLFLSGAHDGLGRRVVQMTVDGTTRSNGLPEGTISASLNPKDGSLAYVLTGDGTDDSSLWLRSQDGKDTLLQSAVGQTLAWPSWSPNGSCLAFLRSDWTGKGETANEIMIFQAEDMKITRVDAVTWNYPPTWSPDGLKVSYSRPRNQANEIVEYSVNSKEITIAASNPDISFTEPSYSDSDTIWFLGTNKEGANIWKTQRGVLSRVTDTTSNKAYPVAL